MPADIIYIWSLPRSRSTALLKAMHSHSKISAFCEPFIERLSDMEPIKQILQKNCNALNNGGKLCIKEVIAFAPEQSFWPSRLFADQTHVFLIRKPEHIVKSYCYMCKKDNNRQVDLQQRLNFNLLYRLFEYITQTQGKTPAVIKSDDLVNHPEIILKKLCPIISLDFEPQLLHWQKMDLPTQTIDGANLQLWYKNARNSSHFSASATYSAHYKDIELTEQQQRLITHNNTIYQKMLAYRINPDPSPQETID